MCAESEAEAAGEGTDQSTARGQAGGVHHPARAQVRDRALQGKVHQQSRYGLDLGASCSL